MESKFDRKEIEKFLFAAYKNDTRLPRRVTRKYLRKQARNIEHGYKIGFRDAAAGKTLVPREDLPDGDNSRVQGIFNMAYTAYREGYEAGAKGGAGK